MGYQGRLLFKDSKAVLWKNGKLFGRNISLHEALCSWTSGLGINNIHPMNNITEYSISTQTHYP